MQRKESEERRRYVRVDIATKINFQVKEKVKEKTSPKSLPAISKNLSVEGICFNSEKELTPGTGLQLQMFIPSQAEPLLLEGEVKWSGPIQGKGKTMFATGVQLYTFGESDENRYLRYVSEKMTERLSRYLHL
ncbi:MAG: PilZ domain-containing protein [Candidatus Omnitrophica bacterium]|nr:PilZ domain-containing protein [Candidatus Omnitrophota bacterium]